MNITVEDYEVISRLCADRSWHNRVSTIESRDRVIHFSKKAVDLFLLEARLKHKHGMKPAKRGGF